METTPLGTAFASTRRILANVSTDQMNLPTPCESWKVSDLVDHIVRGALWFGSSMDAGRSIDDSNLGEFSVGDHVATYDEGIKGSLAAFAKPEAAEKMVELPFGTFPGAAFFGLATTDAFVHGWDLAKATGQPTDLEPELAEVLLEQSKANIRDEFRGSDPQAPFGPEQQAPDGACAADQLAAFLGRHV